jgi:hypothetical protein
MSIIQQSAAWKIEANLLIFVRGGGSRTRGEYYNHGGLHGSTECLPNDHLGITKETSPAVQT